MNLIDAICKRRTYYALSGDTSIPASKIQELLEIALKHTPSAFNMQSARIVLLTGKAHERLWIHTLDALKETISPKQFMITSEKIDSFMVAFGTVLFFEDENVIKQMKKQYPLYAEQFSVWASQANGMLQSNVWMLLEENGLGASLQHYNPLIDKKIQKEWNLPKHWQLVAQMPFGMPVNLPEPKTFIPIKERMKVYAN